VVLADVINSEIMGKGRSTLSKILVIDDDDYFRSMVRELLIEQGHNVIEAKDGEEGLRKYHKNSPDLIVTDILMPAQDGIEVIMELNRIKSTTPIIAVSGGSMNTGDTHLLTVKALGVEHIFEKPLISSEFIETVTVLLGK